jgi:hypothetical protein
VYCSSLPVELNSMHTNTALWLDGEPASTRFLSDLHYLGWASISVEHAWPFILQSLLNFRGMQNNRSGASVLSFTEFFNY